jgi:hypothetical protein
VVDGGEGALLLKQGEDLIFVDKSQIEMLWTVLKMQHENNSK